MILLPDDSVSLDTILKLDLMSLIAKVTIM